MGKSKSPQFLLYHSHIIRVQTLFSGESSIFSLIRHLGLKEAMKPNQRVLDRRIGSPYTQWSALQSRDLITPAQVNLSNCHL